MDFKSALKVKGTLLLLGSGILLTACTTDDVATSKQPEPAPKPVIQEKVSATIVKGMPKDEVLSLLGEPDSIESMKASDGGRVEFWHYKRILSQTEEFQVTGAEMIEIFSPSLGREILVPEEIEELVTTTISQLVEIVLHDDKVLTFTADLQQDIDIRE
jgi:hypothetical protein